MSSIDQRIVEMQFNNKQFEDGVQTSLRSLNDLKTGLDNTEKAGALSALQAGVDTVADRFSALGIIGVTALQNITNSAINAGKRIVSALTIKPVTEGFGEYELKMDSVQTIMASTGESLESVNSYLEELNTYADKTIYSFKDMTSNIGKFTNAGVSLEDAVLAIQGVSNVAAVSGANANEASRAMYNFSQALSAGHVKLIDWKSIENANMATVEFKTHLLESAVAAGTLTKTADGMYHVLTKSNQNRLMEEAISPTANFNESLAYQWMTTETLVNTLGKYADETTEIGKKAFAAAQDIKTITQLYDTLKEAAGSGWAQTWELVIGDFEEAKALLTSVGNILSGFIDGTSDARNEMLRFWKANGGRDAIIQALANAFRGLKQFAMPVIEAFTQIFPPITGEKLVAFSEGLKNLTENFKISDDTADKLKRTFAGVFAGADMLIQTFKFLFGVMGEGFTILLPLSGGLLDVAAAIGDFLVALRESGDLSTVFGEALDKLRSIIGNSAEGIRRAIDNIKDYFTRFGGIDLGPLKLVSDQTKILFEPFEFIADMVNKALSAIKDIFAWFKPYLTTFASDVGTAFGKIGSTTSAVGFDGLLRAATTLLTGGLLIKLKELLLSLGTSGFWGSITDILDGVRGSLEAYQQNIKSKALLNIAIAVGVLAAALWVLSTIPSDELNAALGGVSLLLGELAAVMIILSKNIGKSVKVTAIATAMLLISTAILILSAACRNLAGLSWDEMIRGLIGIAALLGSLVAFEKLIGSGKGLMKIGFALIPLATGVLILSQAVKSLADLSWEELVKGLTGLGVILLEFIAFEKLIGNGTGMMKIGFAMIPLATGVLILSHAVKNMGDLEWDALIKGLTGLGASLIVISLASKLANPSALLALGIAMLGIGVGMTVMSGALAIMGSMDFGTLLQGLFAVVVVLAAVAAASQLVSPVNLLAMSVSLIGVAAALNLMAAALVILGSMTIESVGKSLLALGGGLAILAVAVKLMQGSLAGAAALLLISAALALLVPSLVILGSMDLASVGIMLLSLAGVFGLFAAAAMLLTPILPVMAALAGTIALLGIGVLMLGVGLGLCATALTAFAVAGTSSALAITAMVTSLISLIPMAIEKVGEGLVLLVGTLDAAIPGILTILAMLLEGIILLVIEYTPKIMVMLDVLLSELLDFLLAHVPVIVDVALQMIVGILDAIAENIDDIVLAAISVIVAFLDGVTQSIPMVVDAIFRMLEEIAYQIAMFIPQLNDLGFEMIITFLDGMADTIKRNVPRMVDSAWDMIEAIVDGIVYALEAGVPRLKEQMKRVANALWAAFKEFFGIRSPSTLASDGAGMIIQGILNGLGNGIESVKNKIKDVAGAIWNSFKDFFGIKSPSTLMETEGGQVVAGIEKGLKNGQDALAETSGILGSSIYTGIENAVSGIGEVASNVVSTLGDGLKKGVVTVGNAAKSIGTGIVDGIKGVLGIKSPARTMIEAAHYTGQGLVVGLKDMMTPVADTAEEMGGCAIAALEKTLSQVSDVIDADMELVPTIRPVMDMTDVENGLVTTFSKNRFLNVSASKEVASESLTSSNQNGKVSLTSHGTHNEDNSRIQITNHFTVRSDSDIQKINRDLDRILTKITRAKGVPIHG